MSSSGSLRETTGSGSRLCRGQRHLFWLAGYRRCAVIVVCGVSQEVEASKKAELTKKELAELERLVSESKLTFEGTKKQLSAL